MSVISVWIVLIQYQHVTDGRTDGQTDISTAASTALAMLTRRKIKMTIDDDAIHDS